MNRDDVLVHNFAQWVQQASLRDVQVILELLALELGARREYQASRDVANAALTLVALHPSV